LDWIYYTEKLDQPESNTPSFQTPENLFFQW